MRVIWISLGLLAAFLVVLGVVYEPNPEQAPLAVTDENDVVSNPFVEDSSDNSSDKGGNLTDEELELAVLPPDADGASTRLTTQTAQAQQSVDSPATKINSQSETVQVDNAVSQTSGVTVTENTIKAENVETIIVEQPETPETSKKKLGLAMIAFEKEKKKNKVAVIVHESNSQKLSEKEIKALYLDRLTRWQDGSKVMLYNLPLGDKYRDKFSESILKMTALEADLQESKRRELRIKANDVQVKAKNVVVSYVEQHPNAVAYVPLNLVREKSNVKVILTIP